MRRLLALLLLLATLVGSAGPARAQTQPTAITVSVQAGFDGAYRAGEWFPIIVDVANDGPDLRGELEWQLPGQRSEQPIRHSVDLPRGSRKRVLMSAFARSFARSGQLRLFVGDVAVADQSVSLEPIDADRFVIGVVSSDPTLLNTLEALQISGSGGTVVRHLQPGDLPEQALALRSLNALFLHDLDSSQMSPAQRDALKLWTSLGGQLIVSGGVGGQRAASGLEDLLPAEVGGAVSEGSIDTLVQIGQSQLPSGAQRAPLSELRPRAGAQQIGAGGLVYRLPYGVGSATQTAFDLALLRGWTGEPVLWGQIIDAVPLFAPGLGSRMNQTSVLQQALQLPGLGLPPAGTLMLFLLTYILVIGPLNYLVLRRLRRLEWAWLSVPLVVLLFAAGLYLVGFGVRGNQSQVSQVTVVQASEGQTRGLATGFVALFSPRRATYTISFPAETLIHETRGWDDLGQRATPVSIGEQHVELRDLLVDIASVRTLVVETAVDLPPGLESQVVSGGQSPSGQIRNSGGQALDHVMVVQGAAYVNLGSLAPGASAPFDLSGAPRNFPWGVNLPEDGLFNRKSLVNTLFDGETTLYANGSGPFGDEGLYVIAWSDSPSLPVQIDGLDQAQNGYTLYVVRLRA